MWTPMGTLRRSLLLSLILPVAASRADLRVGVLSDLNGTECQPNYPSTPLGVLRSLLNEAPFDHVFLPGDLVHGECLRFRGNDYAGVVSRMWLEFERRFFLPLRKLASVAVAPGNHDAPDVTAASRETFRLENAGFERFWNEREPALGVERLRVPGVEDRYPYYWAYRVRDALFVVLRSTRTHRLSEGERQKAWLKGLLNSPLARAARFRVVYGHVPPYPVLDPSVGSKYSAVLDREQVGRPDGLVDLLMDARVDLLVAGHSHAPYPGRLVRKSDGRELKILSLPCAHSPRKLYGQARVSPRGFAILNFRDDGTIQMSVVRGADGLAMPLSSFPASIDVRSPLVRYERVSDGIYRPEL